MKQNARRLFLVLTLGLACACGEVEDEEDECSDSECTVQPASRCDGDTLITFGETGLCIGDDCRYEAFTEECAAGCQETPASGSGGAVSAECLPEGSS